MAESEKTRKLLTSLKNLESGGMQRTQQWASMWQTGLRYAFSDQMFDRPQHKDWDWIVINYIWPSMIQEIAKLSKNKQTLIVNAVEQSDLESAETWQSMLQFLWEKGLNKRGMRAEHIYTLLDQQLFGYSVTRTLWDSKVEWRDTEWEGDVRTRLIHPAEFWAIDDENIHDDACGTVRFVNAEWAKKQWPKFKSKIDDEAISFKDQRGHFIGDNIRGQLASAGTYPAEGIGGTDHGPHHTRGSSLMNLILKSDKMNSGSDNTKIEADIKVVRLSETWFHDFIETDETIEEDIPKEELLASGAVILENGVFIGPDGEALTSDTWPRREIEKFKRPKFPRGRRVIRIGDTILNPKEQDQVWKYKKWPFSVVPHYILPHMWQGTDGIQLYRTQQDMINLSATHLLNNVKQYGDRKVMIEKGAIDVPKGRDKEKYKIGKRAGHVIRVAMGAIRGQKLKFIEPAGIPAAVTQFYGLMAQEFKNIQGLQGISRGENQPSDQAATTSSILTVSGNDRIQLQSVFQELWIVDVASQVAEIMQDKYDIGRYVRILGQDDLVGSIQINQKLKTVDFDVDIEAGLVLPFDKNVKQANLEKAYALTAAPSTGPMLPEVLKGLEIPGWQKILERTQSWQQFMQFKTLIDAVKAGEIDPQEGLAMLSQMVQQLFAGPASGQPVVTSGQQPQSTQASNQLGIDPNVLPTQVLAQGLIQ